MMNSRRPAAFTLVELLIAACLSSLVGLIIFGVADEGLTAFARNISINRSYSNARQALDRISVEMQSAGHTPLLIDATGAATSASTAAGIRFWRYNSDPRYLITSTVALTSSSLSLSLLSTSNTGATLQAPAVGDLITIAALGFQAQVASVSTLGTTATVTFSGTVATDTYPVLTASALAAAATPMSCLDWTSVAFITVGTQLRYFPHFISGTTNVNLASNYTVLNSVISVVPAAPLVLGQTSTPTAATAAITTVPAAPFSLGPPPAINVSLYSEAPDYNNRSAAAGTKNAYMGVATANTFTYLQTALSPRNPTIIRNP